MMTYSYHGTHPADRGDVSALPGEDFDTWLRRVRRIAVIEPDRLKEVQRTMAADAQHRTEAARRSRERVDKAARWLIGCLAAVGIAAILHAVIGLSWWVVIAAAIALLVSLAATARARGIERAGPVGGATVRALGWEQMVRIADLDIACQRLLTRVQRAIDQVLSSAVYRADLLDRSVGEAVLRAREWEAAFDLREIARLRADHDARPVAGPRTAAVLESHERALAIAQDRTTIKIRAIEQYAAQVKLADAAFKDYTSATDAAGRNPSYLNLVARTTADEHALGELGALTEQAASAAKVFKDSIRDADQAGAALVFPADEPGSTEPGGAGLPCDLRTRWPRPGRSQAIRPRTALCGRSPRRLA